MIPKWLTTPIPGPRAWLKRRQAQLHVRRCQTCGADVAVWRRYADGSIECIPCSSRRP